MCDSHIYGQRNYVCNRCYRYFKSKSRVSVSDLRKYYNASFEEIMPNIKGWKLSDLHRYVAHFHPDVRGLPETLDTVLYLKAIAEMHQEHIGALAPTCIYHPGRQSRDSSP